MRAAAYSGQFMSVSGPSCVYKVQPAAWPIQTHRELKMKLFIKSTLTAALGQVRAVAASADDKQLAEG